MSEIVNVDNVQAISRTPLLIAAEINSIKEQTKKLVLYNSIEIGRRLVEAKEMLQHGEWGEWLEKEVDYSQRTANNLMKIFKEYGADQLSLLGGNLKSQTFANLGYSQAVALFGIPEEEREAFVKDNNVEEMSTRELEKAIKENEELKKANEKLKKDNKKQSEKAEKLAKEISSIESKNKEALLNREVEIENLKIQIENTQKQLKKAEDSGNVEEVEKLHESLNTSQTELIELNRKIEELEQQLKAKPVEVSEITIEKIPDEVEKELTELRELVKKQSENNGSVIKFKINFDKTVSSIKDLLIALSEIKSNSPEEYDKYKGAVSGLVNKMIEKL